MDEKSSNKTAVKDKNKRRLKNRGNKKFLKYLLTFGSCFIVFSVLVFAFTQVYRMYKRDFSRMEKLSQEVVDLRSAMNIDSVRQYKLQKIMKIINSHNPGLSSAEKYDVASEIYEMTTKYTNLDIDLLCAVITHESAGTWDPRVVSKAGAMGLMQIMPVTGFFLARYEDISWTDLEDVIFNPIYNIRMGARFLSMLIEQYELDGALAAYNGGEKQAALWLKNGKDDQYLWSETREYIPAINKLYNEYQVQGL